MDIQIRCKVYPGQFSSEFAITGTQASGAKFSLFAPTRAVESDEPPTRERSVDGWLKVKVWEQVGDHVIVQLPRESFESGRFVTVSLSQIKDWPEQIEAGQ